MNELQLLTVSEVAQLLRVTKNAVYIMVNRGKLPFVKLSPKCLRFRKQDIEAWIESKKKGGPQ